VPRRSTLALDPKAVPEVLLYQTSDPEFADRAIAALDHAGIPSYRLGAGFYSDSPVPRRNLGLGISIYIRHDKDYAEANAIIIKLGAVVEPRIVLPGWAGWILYSVLAAVVCAAIYVVIDRVVSSH